MSITTDDLFRIIGQKEARIDEMGRNYATVQQSNVKLQEALTESNAKHQVLLDKLAIFEAVEMAELEAKEVKVEA